MESLIKKNVNKATKQAIKKLCKTTSKFEEAVGDKEKVQRLVKLKRVQYEEVLVVVTTKYESVYDVFENQANIIDELKSKIEDIQAHAVTHHVAQCKIIIKSNQRGA